MVHLEIDDDRFRAFAAAEGAASDIRAAYPVRTGNLRDHVVVSQGVGGQYGTAVIVKNTAKHAWLFENGSQARHTDIGANRGSMPPGHVFVPAVRRARRGMYIDLGEMLEREGLHVSGTDDGR